MEPGNPLPVVSISISDAVDWGVRIMGSTREWEYLKYAQDCARWATKAEDQKDQDAFLDMAKAWTQLALCESDVVRQSAFDRTEAKRPNHS